MTVIRGIIPPLVSPVDCEGKLNAGALKKVINYTIKGGVHGVFPIGSTGEAYALNFDERRELIRTVVEEVNKRVPVYAGTGAITTRESVKLTQMAESEGADVVSVLTPMFISPTEDELYEHYAEIAKSTKLPVLLYGNPEKTGVKLSVGLVKRLSQIDNIVGIKDSSGDMTLMGEYIRNTDRSKFNVIAGRDTMILAALVYGGAGAIAATANIAPTVAVSIYENFVKGDLKAALDAQFKLAPLRIAFGLGTFPVIMKEALKLLGMDCGGCLKPVGEISDENREKLYNILKDMSLLDQ